MCEILKKNHLKAYGISDPKRIKFKEIWDPKLAIFIKKCMFGEKRLPRGMFFFIKIGKIGVRYLS